MKLVTIPRLHDPRGSLSVIEGAACPFPIRRVYYLYDIPGGETQRGGHAHRLCHRLIFALSGSFRVEWAEPGKPKTNTMLNRPWEGLEVPPMTWMTLKDFSGGSVALILASHEYDAADYMRDFDEWREACDAV